MANKHDGSGLVYMRNRYLNPQTGQFTQTDPIGLAGGLNLYGYAGGDPVNFSDPFGLFRVILHGPADYLMRMNATLRYIAQRSETFRNIYNSLIESEDVTVRIGPNLISNCPGSTDCIRRQSYMGRGARTAMINVVDYPDDLDMGFRAVHEILHAAGMFSTRVNSGVPAACGNEHNASIAHACTRPIEGQIRAEVRRAQEQERREENQQ